LTELGTGDWGLGIGDWPERNIEIEQEEHRSSGVQEFRRILNLGLEVS